MNFPFPRRALPLHARARMVYCIHKTRKGGHPIKKGFQTPWCALAPPVLAPACTTAAYAAEIPVPADAIPVPQAAPADVADAVSGADLILPDGGTADAERIPMPVDDAPAVWTEGRSAVVVAQAPVDGQSLILPETHRP